MLGGSTFGGSAFSGEAGLALVDQVDGGVLFGGQLLDVGVALGGNDVGLSLGVGSGLVGGIGASLNLVGGLLLVIERGVCCVASNLGDLFEGGDVLHLRLGGRGEGVDADLFGFDATQAVGFQVGSDGVEGPTAVTVGGLGDGGDLLLALLERGFGSVGVG